MKKNKLYLFIKISLLISVISIVGIFILVKRYESQASRNIIINISKRIAAEVGSLFVNYVYDPGFKGKGHLSFGPECGEANLLFNTQGKRNQLLVFLKDELKADVIEFTDNIPSPFAKNFDYQPFNSERLITLRKEYQLGKLTDEIEGEFEKILFLRNWVKNRWEHGIPKNVDYNFNALDILSRAEKGEKFFCSEYSTVFVQCALSIGLQARYVGLFKGHVVAEVWYNELAKWVVMDVDNDLHYARDGIPLNALELHDAWVTRKWDEIQVLLGPEKKVADEKRGKDLLSFYHEFYVRMRNDWFSKKYPHWHPKANSIMNALEWIDKHTSDNILVAREIGNKEELYFPLNITSLNIIKERCPENQIYLLLNTFTPNFSHFIIQINDNKPVRQEDPVVVWKIHDGRNELEVRAVNSLGVEGTPSKIELIINQINQ